MLGKPSPQTPLLLLLVGGGRTASGSAACFCNGNRGRPAHLRHGSSSSACGHRNCRRDGERSPTVAAAPCLSRKEAARVVPNGRDKSCYGNPTSTGKRVSPPLKYTFLSLLARNPSSAEKPDSPRFPAGSRAGLRTGRMLQVGISTRGFMHR